MNFNFLEKVKRKGDSTSEIKKGFKPIIACIVDPESLDSSTKKTLLLIEKNGQFIDWDAEEPFWKENNISNAGKESYVLSECNDRDKYSKRYQNCIGIVVVGEEVGSDRQISIMSHQCPRKIVGDIKEKFIKDLIEKIEEIKSRSKEGSVDVVIFGGQIRNYNDFVILGKHIKRYNDFYYKESIELLNKIFTRKLNLKPTVMTGPNQHPREGPTEVHFDTQNRRLFIFRPFQENNNLNQSYLPDDIKKQKKKW